MQTMNKTLLAWLAAIMFIFYSCTKESNGVIKETLTDVYIVEQLHDVDLYQDSSVNLDIYLAQKFGPSRPVALTLEFLPTKITPSFSINNEMPPFTTHLKLSATDVDTGLYMVNLKARSVYGVQYFHFKVHVIGHGDCTSQMTRVNSSTDELCSSTSNTYSVNIFKDPITPARINIYNLGNFGDSVSVFADLNCPEGDTMTFVIPQQNASGSAGLIDISGNGRRLSTGEIQLHYVYTVPGLIDSCDALIH